MELKFNNNTNYKALNIQSDWVVFAAAVICMLLTLYSLKYDNSFYGFFNTTDNDQSGVNFGTVSSMGKDTRKKTSGNFEWKNIKKENEKQINVGDSLFSGESSKAEITLNDGGKINLDQNTLINFTKIDGIEIPNLNEGNFKIHVKNNLKMAIGGEITDIRGDNSEIQIVIDKNQKTKVKLLSGFVRLKQKNNAKQITLKKDKETVLETIKPVAPVRQIASEIKNQPESVDVVTQESVVAETEIPLEVKPIKQADIYYNYKLYDVYEKIDQTLIYRKEIATKFAININLKWQATGEINEFYGQFYNSFEFANSIKNYKIKNSDPFIQLNELYLGQNFFRFSVDKIKWSEAEVFTTHANFITTPPPILKNTDIENKIIIDDYNQFWKKEFSDQNSFAFYIIESSLDPNFSPASTVISWQNNQYVSIPLETAKTQYLRFRGVNSDLEISNYSQTYTLVSTFSSLPQTPRLTEKKFYEGDNFEMSWEKTAASYNVKIFDNKNKIIHQQLTNNSYIKTSPLAKGTYTVEIIAIDKLGRQSLASKTYGYVLNKPMIKKTMVASNSKPTSEKEKTPEQQIIQQTEKPLMNSKLELKLIDRLNDLYKSSKLQLESGLFTILSQDKMQTKKEAPQFLLLGIKATKWWNNNGLEALFKRKAASINTQADSASPSVFEARHFYRMNLNFNPFSGPNVSTISTIAAVESYRNPSGDQYIQQYDLAKLGLDFNFPISRKWDAGGELLYGVGNNQDSKQEISGRLNYYLQRNWSVGLGYKVEFYETKKAHTFSSGNSYKNGYHEAKGEGFSVLRWHY